jgi:hypothetical protein
VPAAGAHIVAVLRRLLAFVLGGVGAAIALVQWRPGAASEEALLPGGVVNDRIIADRQPNGSVDSVRATRDRALREIARAETYIPAMLAQGDSILKRWPERMVEPLAVYLPDGGAAGYSAAMGQAVRDAFGRWQRVGDIPVTFRFVRDPARADVVIRWIDRFAVPRTGEAEITWKRTGWLQSGRLTLATTGVDGQVLPPEAVYTVALHEIGHLLGLGHSDDPRDVMFPTTEVHDITPRDRRTARLLYALPPGSLRAP